MKSEHQPVVAIVADATLRVSQRHSTKKGYCSIIVGNVTGHGVSDGSASLGKDIRSAAICLTGSTAVKQHRPFAYTQLPQILTWRLITKCATCVL